MKFHCVTLWVLSIVGASAGCGGSAPHRLMGSSSSEFDRGILDALDSASASGSRDAVASLLLRNKGKTTLKENRLTGVQATASRGRCVFVDVGGKGDLLTKHLSDSAFVFSRQGRVAATIGAQYTPADCACLGRDNLVSLRKAGGEKLWMTFL